MNKADFLLILENNLYSLPKDEKDSAIKYYEEYFDDCEDEKEAIKSLGDPADIAKQIIFDSDVSQGVTADSKSDGNSFSENGSSNFSENGENTFSENRGNTSTKIPNSNSLLIILLIIFTFPVWVGPAVTVAAILFTLVVVAISIVFSLGVCSIAFFVSGIFTLFVLFPLGLMLIGLSFICLALTILTAKPFVVGSIKLTGRLFTFFTDLLSSIFNKREVA